MSEQWPSLAQIAERGLCRCADLPQTHVENFSSAALTCTWLRHRGPPQWWLGMARCVVCHQHWLIAQEERLNDVNVMQKIGANAARDVLERDVWPDDLDQYETLLRLGASHGHAARFWEAKSALPIAIDLLGQRPSITDAEMAALVNLPEEEFEPIGRQARLEIAAKGYPYPWKPA